MWLFSKSAASLRVMLSWDVRVLLFCSTKTVAVVAAIIKSGLRIMPHSGGRVGKGIYLASENGKR